MESLGRLAGGIAHDFNNLLSGILGNADLARERGAVPGEIAECLQEIRTASLRGRELVQRILAFSRPQPHTRRPIALGPVVAEAAALLRAAMPPGVWLETDLDPNCPAVLADSTQIHQIVMNLGTNAGHAMEQKPGRVTISLKAVIAEMCPPLSDLKPGTYACLSVSDQGIGMTDAVRERIFEPFFTTKEHGRGTGLGLAAVHGFVKNHGGAIDVQSEAGKGAIFAVYLPSTEKEPEATVPATPRRAAAEEGLNILVIDDEELVVSVLQRILRRLGHKVTALMNAEEAIALFERDPREFDLVLTDMNMPVITGLEVAKRVRATRKDIAIILASGNVSEELRAQATDAGANRVISKPVTMAELEAAVRAECEMTGLKEREDQTS